MFIVLYRWKIKSGKEQQFIEGWSAVTEYFRENHDSLGSRLHRGDDGLFYGYAQWKSAEDREKAFSADIEFAGSKAMTEAIEERLPPVQLGIVADFIVQSEKV